MYFIVYFTWLGARGGGEINSEQRRCFRTRLLTRQATQMLLHTYFPRIPDSRPCPDSLTSRARYRQTLRLVPPLQSPQAPHLRYSPKLPSHESLGHFWSLDLRCGGNWVGGGSRVCSGWAWRRGRLSPSSSSSPSTFLSMFMRVQVTLIASSYRTDCVRTTVRKSLSNIRAARGLVFSNVP